MFLIQFYSATRSQNELLGDLVNMIMKNKGKTILGIGLLLTAVIFVPLIPVTLFSSKNELISTDYRVKKVVTGDDFTQIKNKIRGGKLVNVYQAIKFTVGLSSKLEPIVMIRETTGAELGNICVTTEINDGGLYGQGTEYHLNKIGTNWEIVSQSYWVE